MRSPRKPDSICRIRSADSNCELFQVQVPEGFIPEGLIPQQQPRKLSEETRLRLRAASELGHVGPERGQRLGRRDPFDVSPILPLLSKGNRDFWQHGKGHRALDLCTNSLVTTSLNANSLVRDLHRSCCHSD
jgi:hypothetical protein